ncbi:hypothetical protein B0H65DRAFT_66927 [Neurospora tetraspora]|uniref:2EXR domain-containing protein n=1 Tax=Neurospora tetraspora TaxID=94610 RepID=A0AAE0JRE7_9PEZI|nr:hypothetical protein B0H65DRAFT_66927 [Neurospora tetraspora]
MPPTSLEHRILTDRPDHKGIINDCIDLVRCRPEESQAGQSVPSLTASNVRWLNRTNRPSGTANSTGKGKLYERFCRFEMLPKELRIMIWKMSVDPVMVIGYLSAHEGLVSNSVTLSNYEGPLQTIVPAHYTLLGTRDHYKRIRLFEINRESRELAFKYWGSPLPSSPGKLPTYLFNPHTDTLAVRLSLLPRETDSSDAMYDSSPWQGSGFPTFTVPTPTALLSRVHRIELQLDRVENLRPGGYDWTSPGATNPFAFLFHFPNLRHLTFVFRRPQLIDIPQTSNGRTVIDGGNQLVPVTEAVGSYDYYHFETIQCLHSFLRLARSPETRDRAKTTLRNLRTIGVNANPRSLRLDPYWFPEQPYARVAKFPKGVPPLTCVDNRHSLDVVSPVDPGTPAQPMLHQWFPWDEGGLAFAEFINDFNFQLAGEPGVVTPLPEFEDQGNDSSTVMSVAGSTYSAPSESGMSYIS